MHNKQYNCKLGIHWPWQYQHVVWRPTHNSCSCKNIPENEFTEIYPVFFAGICLFGKSVHISMNQHVVYLWKSTRNSCSYKNIPEKEFTEIHPVNFFLAFACLESL